jgi:hypothetical protein
MGCYRRFHPYEQAVHGGKTGRSVPQDTWIMERGVEDDVVSLADQCQNLTMQVAHESHVPVSDLECDDPPGSGNAIDSRVWFRAKGLQPLEDVIEPGMDGIRTEQWK